MTRNILGDGRVLRVFGAVELLWLLGSAGLTQKDARDEIGILVGQGPGQD